MSVHVDLKAALLRAHEAEREIMSTGAWKRGACAASLYVYEVDRTRAQQIDPSAVLDAPGVLVFWVVGSSPRGSRYFRVTRGTILVVEETIGATVTLEGEVRLVVPVDARLGSLA